MSDKSATKDRRLRTTQDKQLNWLQGLGIICLIWLAGAICDRLWFWLDRSVPAWDQADYLNGVLNYWEALQNPQWLNGEWWRGFWLQSSKIPPLNYILTVPLINLFGTTEDAATLVMLFYSAVLLISVYGLGVCLFGVTTGLWAAGLCQLIPGLYYHRLEFILDYPLTTVITFSFWLLTLWKFQPKTRLTGWIFGIIWGISFGLAILTKQTALFFLFFPLLWLFTSYLKQRQWMRLSQLITALIVGVAVAFPWYRTNWLLILTSGKRATVDSAIAEGDPALTTIDAWTYYGKILPELLSWHLLLIPIAGFIFYAIGKYLGKNSDRHHPLSPTKKWRWLAVFLLGGYLLSSLNINKDARYILPLLPVLSLILAVGLLSWTGRWKNYLRWGTVLLAAVLMLLNIFPLGGDWIAAKLSPRVRHHPYTGKPFPHPQVIQEITRTSPHLRTTLGVLPSTPQINQHNFSFYGKQDNAKVSGRQVGVRSEEVQQDGRSLDWFITKTGDQGSIPESQPAIVNLVESGGDFRLQKSWQLPDDSQLKLYHRDRPLVSVTAIDTVPTSLPKLNRVIVPKTSPPGVPIPVTYEWSGEGKQLQNGIVLLTWSAENNSDFWLHDHGIGMGALNFDNANQNKPFQVTERTAMLPPATIKPGKYSLKASYLDRQTEKTQPISIPSVTITINPTATATPAPELDLVTQLRNTAPKMAENIQGLEPVFAQTARINQYDARQDYLEQTEISLSHRLQHQQVNSQQQIDWMYAVALSQVLQQDVDGAIASFQTITQIDPQNPYGYAYLAFVYLYDWNPKPAQTALDRATAINPNIPEIKTLQGAAAVMQGKFIKAWKLLIS